MGDQQEITDVTKIKLALYGYGEWIDEPDEVHFWHKGIECLILRNEFGALCGYCQIPEGHKYHGKEYDDIPYEVHGGLTFCGVRDHFGSNGFWIGFDCSHSFDVSPSTEIFIQESRKRLAEKMPHLEALMQSSAVFARTYKNMAFVEQECKQLAEQIINEK